MEFLCFGASILMKITANSAVIFGRTEEFALVNKTNISSSAFFFFFFFYYSLLGKC